VFTDDPLPLPPVLLNFHSCKLLPTDVSCVETPVKLRHAYNGTRARNFARKAYFSAEHVGNTTMRKCIIIAGFATLNNLAEHRAYERRMNGRLND
jgi:hypothetical protein